MSRRRLAVAVAAVAVSVGQFAWAALPVHPVACGALLAAAAVAIAASLPALVAGEPKPTRTGNRTVRISLL